MYHSATQLTDKLSVIVDSGAWTNLIGETLARRIAQRAVQAGHKPKQDRMATPPPIRGVGNGAQQCTWELTCPVAVPDADGQASGANFTAPVVSGPSKNLPGLLGLRSLEGQRAIIVTGKQELILPGKAEVKIGAPPISLRIPLIKAPSGHLVMVVDDYEKLVAVTGGLPERVAEFMAEPNTAPSTRPRRAADT